MIVVISQKLAEACDIFNPLVLKDLSETEVVTKLYFMAEKLKHFKYDNIYTDGFISRLKKKCLLLLKQHIIIMT